MPAYTPLKMTPDVHAQLQVDGFHLPDSFPFPARVAPDMNSAHGWRVQTVGSGKDEGATIYVAPDGSKFTRATHGARVVLVGLSKRTSPLPLRVVPGSRRPTWVITDAPKGEVPEHLRRYLLKPGQKLSKGEKREVDALLVEPDAAPRTTTGRAGSAVAILGPRPKAGTPERAEWNRKYRALRKDHFTAYREQRKQGKGRQGARARA